MLTSDKERLICEKYSAMDSNKKVHCYECPLMKGNPAMWDFRCKANSHYNPKTREWEYDSETEGEEDDR